jgi:hypothetical protein
MNDIFFGNGVLSDGQVRVVLIQHNCVLTIWGNWTHTGRLLGEGEGGNPGGTSMSQGAPKIARKQKERRLGSDSPSQLQRELALPTP